MQGGADDGKLGVNMMRRVWANSGSRWVPTESERASVYLRVTITGSQVRDGGFHATEGAEFANLCFVTAAQAILEFQALTLP